MRLYIDESGNTGVVSLNLHNQLYQEEQPHFVLCAVKIENEDDEKQLREKYRNFLNHFGIEGEIKGSDLMMRNNNDKLIYFINNILDDIHFHICCYDKKFYLATLISAYLLGIGLRNSDPILYYGLASALSLENDSLFIEYCKTAHNPTKVSIQSFLIYICNYHFEHINDKINLYKTSAKDILEHSSINELKAPYLSKGYYQNGNYVNVINLNALGELVLLLRYNHHVKSSIDIFHDHILEFEDEFIDSFKETNTKPHFVESKDDVLIQLADNAAGIFRKALTSSINLFAKGMDWKEKWFPTVLRKLLVKIGMDNLKVVCPIRDQTLLYCIKEMFAEDYPISRHCDKYFLETFLYYQIHVMNTIFSLDYTFTDV